MLTLTEAAVEYLEGVLDPGDILRVGVKGGGCAGFSYDMEVQTEDKIRSDDSVIDEHSFKVAVDTKSAFLLSETQVDYQNSLQESGFKFSNAKATNSCGCGTSFSCEE